MQHFFSSLALPVWQKMAQQGMQRLAPLEIHGARTLGYGVGDDCRLLGFRYVLDVARDVLVREDVNRSRVHG